MVQRGIDGRGGRSVGAVGHVALAALMMTTGLATVIMAAPAEAQDAARSFAIPAQPLATALTAFGQQSGLQVSAQAPLLDGRTSKGVSGAMSAAEALSQLLSGTGLTFQLVGTTVTLAPAPQAANGAIQLGAVRVDGGDTGTGVAQANLGGNLRGPNSDPVARRLNPPTTIGSKDPVSLREIPQSVTVITQDEIQTRNMLTVDDVIRATPGMTVLTVNPNDTTYSARGVPITTFQLDGVPTAIPSGGAGVTPDNLAMYDRVEVLRGPAGLFNGFGGDGGVINLVRKRAPDTFQMSGLLSGGTYDNVRGQIDVGAPLNADGSIRFRAVGSEQYQHLMQDTTWQHDQQAYGTIEADLAPGLTARAGISYTDTNGRLMYGIPYALEDGSFIHIPRSAYIGAPWNHYHNDRLGEFAELSQQFGGGWTAKIAYNHYTLDTRYLFGISDLIYDKENHLGELYDYGYNQKENQHAADLYLSGPFRLLGRTHRITIGANYLHDRTYGEGLIYDADGYDAFGDVENVDIYDNSAFAPPSGFDSGTRYITTINTQQIGLYANLRLSLTDRLTLIGGGRITWWRARQTVPDDPKLNYWGNENTSDRRGPKASPFVGAIYDLDRTFSVYASYTSIYKPQTGAYTFDGRLIEPVVGRQYEVGIKGEHFGGRLTTSLALFDTAESNNAVSDPAHDSFYLPSGRVRSRGVEVQAHGEIAHGWTMLAGYTYDHSKRDQDNSSNDATVGLTPKNLFKISTDYVLPGILHSLTIGGAVNAQTKAYFFSVGQKFWQPGYTIADVRIAYAFTPKISLTASVTNMFNKYYLASVGGAVNTLGDPRKVLFTLRAAY